MKYIKKFESYSINEEEGIRKFFTGFDSKDDEYKAKMDFYKSLEEVEERVNKNPSDYVFRKEYIEKKARENKYRGSIRVQRGGGKNKKFFVVYDEGTTGLENLASAAGGSANVFRRK
jgi:hypothetical protein